LSIRTIINCNTIGCSFVFYKNKVLLIVLHFYSCEKCIWWFCRQIRNLFIILTHLRCFPTFSRITDTTAFNAQITYEMGRKSHHKLQSINTTISMWRFAPNDWLTWSSTKHFTWIKTLVFGNLLARNSSVKIIILLFISARAGGLMVRASV